MLFVLERMSCSICKEDTGNKVVTGPCSHTFHKECLWEIDEPVCPTCGVDISHLMFDQSQLYNLVLSSSREEGDVFDVEECMSLVSMHLRCNLENWFQVFTNVIVDRVYDAREYFCRISSARQGEGLFCYTFKPRDFWEFVDDPSCKSRAVWCNKDQFEGKGEFGETAKTTIGIVQSAPQTDFGILVAVLADDTPRNQINNARAFQARVLSTDEERRKPVDSDSGYIAGVVPLRISQKDVISSFAKCQDCRERGHCPNEPNPEHTWARKLYKRLPKTKQYPPT